MSRSEPPRRRARRWPQVLAAILVGLVLLAGGALVAGQALVHRYESSVSRDVLLDPRARDMADSQVGWRRLSGPLNYLLIGSDLRESNPGAGQRSDTILVVQVDRDLNHAYVISIPRDLRVEIPEVGGTSFGGARQRINAAFEAGGGGSGGVQLLSATLTALTGMRFDGAAVVDFGGFTRVIDSLGGVNMCVDTEVRSIHTKRLFTVGCREMNGAEALDYSRQRYGLPGGDFDRQRHQQQLVKAILSKALDSGMTRNPLKLDQFIRGIGQSLTLDTGEATLTDLIVALRNIRPDSLTGIRVPSYPQSIGGVSYVLLRDGAEDLFRAMRDADLATWVQQHPEWVNSI
ncbi:LCP family protein [Catellatospora sp. NPDC049133]|jgi:LCP family protein required for cell wall assembly|uniref:LCP family protein n=1 Tax=Catellatospora sp. NPDC049133 TaxID=3155499 RepID=UPI0034094680